MNRWDMIDEIAQEGAIIAASTGGSICGTVHAGRVRRADFFVRGAFSMTPQCGAYRKADGTRLAQHERNGSPMLTRPFSRTFAAVRNDPAFPGILCRYCVAVVDAQGAGLPIEEYVKLTTSVNRAMGRARRSAGEDTP